jgi:hypothetical protein
VALVPVHGHNPMTPAPVIDAIGALINMRAEDWLELVANQMARRLGYDQADAMHVTVATPGMWPDRLVTKVIRQLLANDSGGVL